MKFARGATGIGIKDVIRQEAADSWKFPGIRAEDLKNIDNRKYSARKPMGKGAKLIYLPGTRLSLTVMKRRYEMAELLLSKGIRINSSHKLAECLVQADERMKRI